jgi:hypothetical protein
MTYLHFTLPISQFRRIVTFGGQNTTKLSNYEGFIEFLDSQDKEDKADMFKMFSLFRRRALFVLKSEVPAQLPGPQRKEEQ